MRPGCKPSMAFVSVVIILKETLCSLDVKAEAVLLEQGQKHKPHDLRYLMYWVFIVIIKEFINEARICCIYSVALVKNTHKV